MTRSYQALRADMDNPMALKERLKAKLVGMLDDTAYHTVCEYIDEVMATRTTPRPQQVGRFQMKRM